MQMHFFQISADGRTEAIPAGMTALSGQGNDGWGTYDTIRKYFLEHAVSDDGLYGFFLPSFQADTGLDVGMLTEFVAQNPDHDAYLFNPHVRQSACFLNVFEAGDAAHPGLQSLAQAFLSEAGLALPLTQWVTSDALTAEVNVVLARPVFWNTWFGLTEKIAEMAGQPASPYAAQLNALVDKHRMMKALLTDKLAALVLGLDQELSVKSYDWQDMPASARLPVRLKQVCIALEGYKQQYLQEGQQESLDAFFALRNLVLTAEAVAPTGTLPEYPTVAVDHTADDALFYASITHVPLPVAFPEYVTPIYLGESQGPGKLNLRDLASQWEAHHPVIGGMAGNFALKNYLLKHHPQVKRIGVCMYRKFISRERISGVAAKDNWMMDVISDGDFEKQAIDSMMSPGDNTFLIGKSCGLVVAGKAAGYLLHYQHAHHVEDLLHFTAVAVELGVIERTEVDAFFNEKEFIIGGIELGVFPADFWLAAVSGIEAIVWECVTRFPVSREGYQTRAWAFCAERFGSYLLLRELRARFGNADSYAGLIGQLNLITANNDTQYTPSN